MLYVTIVTKAYYCPFLYAAMPPSALDALWYTIFSIIPLIRYMPGDLWEETLTLSSDITYGRTLVTIFSRHSLTIP